MKKYSIIFVFLFLIVSLIINFLETKDDGCVTKEYFYKLSINGIIKEKYFDHTQHGVPVIVVENKLNHSLMKINFFMELSGCYDSLQVSDSIFKMTNNNELKIRKDYNGQILHKTLQYNCQ